MVEEIRALKEEVARVKAWEAQKQRYQLTQFGDGAGVVYALKNLCAAPNHRISCVQSAARKESA